MKTTLPTYWVSKSMNKTELIDKIAELTTLEKTKVSKVVNAFLEVVTEAMAKHEPVTLIGFGTFKVRRRQARKGVNPQTRQEMTIPAADVPFVSFGESLKEAVKRKKKSKTFLSAGDEKKGGKKKEAPKAKKKGKK